MGKSATAQLFAEEGCSIWDADSAVHRLYAVGGAAVPLFRAKIPNAVVDGAISRPHLKDLISKRPNLLKLIEQLVHPLVRADREQFIAADEADIGVFDIPLLFETGSQVEFDAVACVYIDDETQKQRVMARGTMSEDTCDMILSKQMPIAEKRAKSDYEIRTDTPENARAQVRAIVEDIRGKLD